MRQSFLFCAVVATRHNRFTGSSRAVMEVYILNRGFEGSR